MDNEARILLDDTLAFCRRDNQPERLMRALEQCIPANLNDDEFRLSVPTRFAAAYLEKQRGIIEGYLEEITFMPLHLELTVDEGAAAKTPAPAPARTPVPAPAEVSTQMPQPAEPASRDGNVHVKTSVSAADWQRMMNEYKSNEVTSAKPSTAVKQAGQTPDETAIDEKETYPAVDVNSKFTFDTFVFGDENRHAYQSALRFAAFAEEPGQCQSLFIYGNSGLGKTHLLFAIKNYLAVEKPQLRVKYANSQTYLDDFFQKIEERNYRRHADPTERKPDSGIIMSDYRSADILIIDDIQNIIGRTASVEFFFQLVDEFIRNGKKIAIASDRAPKDLGLDERLTSRFNAGMLCLVSTPGFEMKYAILKNYYENTICGAQGISPEGEVPNLLSGMDLQQGHLSKEQLQHMAEISGNNIRELQGFCERCAVRAYEREQEGAGLTAEDIDKIADEFFDTAHKVVRPNTIMSVVEEFYHVSHEDLISKKRPQNIVLPRHVAAYLTFVMCDMPYTAIGNMLNRDHSTVMNSIKVIEKKEKDDARFKEDLRQLKNVIMLKS